MADRQAVHPAPCACGGSERQPRVLRRRDLNQSAERSRELRVALVTRRGGVLPKLCRATISRPPSTRPLRPSIRPPAT
eukprot:625243-Prorocentrum_minimum.AAC.1